MSETDIQRSILHALKARRIMCWRANSGVMSGTYKGKKRFVRMSPPGTPDIIGILPGGRFFGIEVKTARGKVSVTQQAWGGAAMAQGAAWGVARSAAEAMDLIDSWTQQPTRETTT